MEKEVWFQLSKIPIDEYKNCQNYYVSNMGNVKSVINGVEKHLKKAPRVGHGNAYLRVNLSPIRKSKTVHRLVMLAFCYREDHDTMTIDHINEDTLDNRLSNLQWLSHKHNVQKSQLFEYRKFDKAIRQKIKDAFIIDRKSYEEIKEEFNISFERIQTIVNDDTLVGVNDRKRNSFTIDKKLLICKQHRDGTSVVDLAKENTCAKTYIYKILKEEKEGKLNG